MTRRRIETFKPFAFQADFSSPQPETPASGDLPLEQLAELGARLQAEAMVAVRAPLDAQAVARLESAIERLQQALGELSRLAEHLDAAGQAGLFGPGPAAMAERAAQAVCDGQQDLFAACKSLDANTAAST